MKKIGIIGAGGMAKGRCQAIASMPGVQLSAVASRRRENAERLAGRFKIKHVLSHYTEMLPLGLDAVIVATPNMYHYEMSKWALKNGMDVLVEGPLCRKVSEAEELKKIARMRRLIVEVGYNAVYNPIYEKGREILTSGAIGEPVIAYCTMMTKMGTDRPWYYSQKLSGGMPLTHLSYSFYRIRWFLGNPVAVSAQANRKVRRERGTVKEETCAVILTFARGVIACVAGSYVAPRGFPNEGLRIVCTEGALRILAGEKKLEIYQGEKIRKWTSSQDTRMSRISQTRSFIGLIRRREQGKSPIDTAIADVKTAEAISKSIRLKKTILI